MKALPRLYAIADASFGDPVQLAKALFEGGARLVQVRNKNCSSRDLLAQVEAIQATAPPEARVIVNDRSDIALLAGAGGVHLGQADLSPVAARKVVGSAAVVGVSTHNLSQAVEADALPVDYIAVGPIFQTTTKANPAPVLGLELLREICSTVHKPVVAIGGITLETAEEVFLSGAVSVAVISDLLSSAKIADRTRDWLRRYNQIG